MKFLHFLLLCTSTITVIHCHQRQKRSIPDCNGLSSQLPWSSGLYGGPNSWSEQYGYWPADLTSGLNAPVYKIIKPRSTYEESFSQPDEGNGFGGSPDRY